MGGVDYIWMFFNFSEGGWMMGDKNNSYKRKATFMEIMLLYVMFFVAVNLPALIVYFAFAEISLSAGILCVLLLFVVIYVVCKDCISINCKEET